MSVVPLRGIIISSQAKLQRKHNGEIGHVIFVRTWKTSLYISIYIYIFHLAFVYVMIRIHNRIKGSDNCVETFTIAYHFVRGSWYSPVNNLTMLFGIRGNVFKRFKSFELFPRTWPLVKQAFPSLNKTDQTLSFVFRSRPLKIILIFTSRNNKFYDNNAWKRFPRYAK